VAEGTGVLTSAGGLHGEKGRVKKRGSRRTGGSKKTGPGWWRDRERDLSPQNDERKEEGGKNEPFATLKNRG